MRLPFTQRGPDPALVEAQQALVVADREAARLNAELGRVLRRSASLRVALRDLVAAIEERQSPMGKGKTGHRLNVGQIVAELSEARAVLDLEAE